MIKNILKILFNTGKSATKTSKKSVDFIDDLLEKEYLSNAVDNLKTSSGKVVEKAGMVYQQTKDAVEDHVDLNKIKDVGDKIIEKGKAVTEDLSESMQDSSQTIKSVFKEGEKIVKDFIGDEEE